MNKGLISLAIEEAGWASADDSISQLETVFSGLIALDSKDRRKIVKMGNKSESFCREAVDLMEQNPQVIPPSLSVADARADLEAIDKLRPRMIRLQRLIRRMTDSEIALGSDVIGASLQGYKLLKVAGKNQGLDDLRSSLGVRFKGRPRLKADPEPEPDEEV